MEVIYSMSESFTNEVKHIPINIKQVVKSGQSNLEFHGIFINLWDHIESMVYDNFINNSNNYILSINHNIINYAGIINYYEINIGVSISCLTKKNGQLRKTKVDKRLTCISFICTKKHNKT